jgi:putative toxin-antitoxin system antitoxin component (TIGR02293 family)
VDQPGPNGIGQDVAPLFHTQNSRLMEGSVMAGRTEHEQLAISTRDFRFYAFEALGGGQSITEMLQMIGRGFPSGQVIRLAAKYEIPEALLHRALRISASTFQRRKRGGRFSADESDRLVRVVGLYGMAEDVLGSKRDASDWISAPNRSLGGVSPAEFAITETGAREVEELLGRIAHGVAA